MTVLQICPEMQVNEMHALYDEHHKVLTCTSGHKCRIDGVPLYFDFRGQGKVREFCIRSGNF